MEDVIYLFEDSLNENFESLIVRPKEFFKKVQLWRVSLFKEEKIGQYSFNPGTLLSKARFSSFWIGGLKEWTYIYGFRIAFSKMLDDNEPDLYDPDKIEDYIELLKQRRFDDDLANGFVINSTKYPEEFVKKHLPKVYLYGLQIKGYKTGVGWHNRDEYTIDNDVAPDSVDVLDYDFFKKNISLKYVPEEKFNEMRKAKIARHAAKKKAGTYKRWDQDIGFPYADDTRSFGLERYNNYFNDLIKAASNEKDKDTRDELFKDIARKFKLINNYRQRLLTVDNSNILIPNEYKELFQLKEEANMKDVLYLFEDVLVEKSEFQSKIDRRNWKFVIKSMNYVDINSFDKAYPELASLSKHQKIKKLKEALYKLPTEKKQEILKKVEPEIEKVLREIHGRAKAGKIVQGAGSGVGATAGGAAGGVTGYGVGVGIMNSMIASATAGGGAGAAIASPFIALIGAMVAGIVIIGSFALGAVAGVIPPLIVGGAIRASNTKSQRKELAMRSQESIMKEVKLEMEEKQPKATKKQLALAESFLDEFLDDSEFLLEDCMCIDDEKSKIADVLDQIKDITYGFISKKDGSRIDDRDWIHNCKDLGNYYDVNRDPEVTLKNKLGICQDQSILVRHLLHKYHPDLKVQLYAMTTGRYGHCVPTFCDNGDYYYLENAWDKEMGLHGPFESKEGLEKYLSDIYHKHHDEDTGGEEVIVEPYDRYESLISEAVSMDLNWNLL